MKTQDAIDARDLLSRRSRRWGKVDQFFDRFSYVVVLGVPFAAIVAVGIFFSYLLNDPEVTIFGAAFAILFAVGMYAFGDFAWRKEDRLISERYQVFLTLTSSQQEVVTMVDMVRGVDWDSLPSVLRVEALNVIRSGMLAADYLRWEEEQSRCDEFGADPEAGRLADDARAALAAMDTVRNSIVKASAVVAEQARRSDWLRGRPQFTGLHAESSRQSAAISEEASRTFAGLF